VGIEGKKLGKRGLNNFADGLERGRGWPSGFLFQRDY